MLFPVLIAFVEDNAELHIPEVKVYSKAAAFYAMVLERCLPRSSGVIREWAVRTSTLFSPPFIVYF